VAPFGAAKVLSGRTEPEEREAERLDGYANNGYHRIRCVVL